MSHYTQVRTRFRDPEILRAALADVGFPVVEVHAAPVALYGYQGDARADTAEVIIRRANIGPASNDVGFKRHADGTYRAIVSEYDARSNGWHKARMDQISQRYAYHAIRREAARAGLRVTLDSTQQRQEVSR